MGGFYHINHKCNRVTMARRNVLDFLPFGGTISIKISSSIVLWVPWFTFMLSIYLIYYLCIAYGMVVSSEKSMFLLNCSDSKVCDNLTQFFPFQMSKVKDRFKYLGYFLKPNCYKCEDWNSLVQNVEKRISQWTYKFLFLGGRLILDK